MPRKSSSTFLVEASVCQECQRSVHTAGLDQWSHGCEAETPGGPAAGGGPGWGRKLGECRRCGGPQALMLVTLWLLARKDESELWDLPGAGDAPCRTVSCHGPGLAGCMFVLPALPGILPHFVLLPPYLFFSLTFYSGKRTFRSETVFLCSFGATSIHTSYVDYTLIDFFITLRFHRCVP